MKKQHYVSRSDCVYTLTDTFPTPLHVVFTLGAQPLLAIKAHLKSLSWQQLFHLALVSKLPTSEIKDLAIQVSDGLKSKRRWIEAGKVLLEYGRDVEGAVAVLCEGDLFGEAMRLVSVTISSKCFVLLC